MNIRIGQGIDFHRLEKGLRLVIGGVTIPSEKGCVAHSDGDVLLHAMCDAILGAAGFEDIGHQFPDSDMKFKNIESTILLSETLSLVKKAGFSIINIDSTLCLEKPKIAPHIRKMKEIVSGILEVDPSDVGIKATTTEKMGFAGREEGVFALSVALLSKS